MERIDRARRPLDRGKLERQMGRMLERDTRAAGRYTIKLIADSSRSAGLRLQWSTRPDWNELARHSERCYVLRTNTTDCESETLGRA